MRHEESRGTLWVSAQGTITAADARALAIFDQAEGALVGEPLRALLGGDAAGTLAQQVLPRPVLYVTPGGDARVLGFASVAREPDGVRVSLEARWQTGRGAEMSSAPWVFERTVRDGTHAVLSKLTAARTAMELAMESEASLDERRAAQEVVLRTLGRVKSLLDQVVETVGSEGLSHAESALDAVVEVAMARVRRDAPGAKIERREGGNDLRVVGDAGALTEALMKLVENAVTADVHARGVELCCEHDPARRRVRVRVLDRGVGMSPERAVNAFRMFHSGVGRAGVGLSRARYLASLFGGTVSLVSQEGVGTTATLTLSCVD